MSSTRCANAIALDALNFRYSITGDTPAWRPLRAFDDGSKVYVEFPARIDQGEAPPLFVVGAQGSTDLVNYRVKGNYYVVDQLFAAAELRLGADPQQIVRIERTDGKPKRSGLGAAWQQRSGGDPPRDYLNVRLDDPSWPEPVTAALFAADEGREGRLVWSRRRADG